MNKLLYKLYKLCFFEQDNKEGLAYSVRKERSSPVKCDSCPFKDRCKKTT